MRGGPGTGQGGLSPEVMVQQEVEGSSERQDPEDQITVIATMTEITGTRTSTEYWGLGMMSLLRVTPTSK